MICNLGVVGSNPTRGSKFGYGVGMDIVMRETLKINFLPVSMLGCGAKEKTGEYQSGQMGQTVNLLVYTFGGSNPSSPTYRNPNV